MHAQIAERIRASIVSGERRPGDLLPSEVALGKAYGVSRPVIRQAMQSLESQGLIRRKSGKGTFVRAPGDAFFSGTPIASVDDLLRAGLENKLETLERAEVPADSDVAAALRIEVGALVTLRVGVRTYGGLPFGYQREHILLEIGRRTMANEQITSMLQNFQLTSGVQNSDLLQSASAVAATEDVARHLDLAVGDPVLQIDWTGISQEGVPTVFARSRYRSDRYRHVNRIPIHSTPSRAEE
jgi:DNA-binding GntR family transcriptional regulator